MTTIPQDNNSVHVMACVLNTDGATVTLPQGDAATHYLMTSDGTTGTDHGNQLAENDDNGAPTLTATDATGKIIPLYADSSGNLLVKST